MMRDYAGIARRYAEGVVAGLIPANRWTNAACARHLSDLERAAAGWEFYFDPEDAAHLCAFTEQMPHIKGEQARRGQRIHLEPWQVFILANLNGWRRVVDGCRRFQIAYIEVPRKNGKSTMAAPPLLFLLSADGEAGPEIYTAATKMGQARIVFDVAAKMARKVPDLRSAGGLIVQTHKILAADNDGEMRPLEAKKLDGLNPHGACVDELHEHRDRVVWDALVDALGARANPLMLAITTAGEHLEHVCYEQHDYGAKVLDRVLVDETYFAIMFSIDKGDDPMDAEAWPKANPNLGISKRREYMQTRADQARATPAAMGEFMRKHCGIWTRTGATAIEAGDWQACEVKGLSRDEYRQAGGLLGLDLALRDDMVAIAYLHEDPSGVLTVFVDHFATEESVNRPGRDNLKAWGAQGLIEIHPGAMINLERIEQVAIERAAFHGAEETCVDPYLGGQLMQNLDAGGLNVIEMRQRPSNLSAPFERFIAQTQNGTVRHDGDPVLTWQVSNVIEIAKGDFKVPGKLTGRQKIDGVSAIITAGARLGTVPEAPKVSYLASSEVLAL